MYIIEWAPNEYQEAGDRELVPILFNSVEDILKYAYLNVPPFFKFSLHIAKNEYKTPDETYEPDFYVKDSKDIVLNCYEVKPYVQK